MEKNQPFSGWWLCDMAYLGTYFVGDRLLFTVNTHNNKGNVADAASVPFYNIYKEETQAAVFTGTMAKLDDTGTTGYYSEIVGLTGVFVPGWYSIYAQANVSNVVGSTSFTFSITTGTMTTANVVQISGDAVAADNLESQFDGTGLSGDTYPSTQAQVSNIALVGSPSYDGPTSYVLSTGTQTGGTYLNVDTSNAVYHVHTDSGGLLDLYYQYTLAADEIATSVFFKGRINGVNDSVHIQAYDWTTSSWVTLHTLPGISTTTDTSVSPALVGKYTGTGFNVGKVRIRIVNAVTLSSATLYVDQLIIGKTITSRTVGYQDGAVWIDTVNGTTGTASWVNGVADNPCLLLSEAYIIASNIGLNSFNLAAGSTITLTQSAANSRFVGAGTINLNGQSVSDAYFQDAYTINGTSTGDDCEFIQCGIGTATLYHAYFMDCRFKGTLTFVSGNDYFIIRGSDTYAGAGNSCTFVFDENMDALFRDWRGGIQLNSMASGTSVIIDGAGRVIVDGSSTDGSLTVRGSFDRPTGVDAFILAGGTFTDSARWAEDQNVYAVTNGWVTASGSAGSAPSTTDIDNALSASHGTGSWTSGGIVGTVDANVIQWRGTQPNNLQSGRVDAYVGVNADKTGYYLADGSMAVFTGTVSSVTSVTNPVTVNGYVVVTGTVNANIVSSDNIDFTALQKTSLNSSTPASVGAVTGNIAGTVQAVVDGYVTVSGTVGISSSSLTDIDTVLSLSHGTGSWAGGSGGSAPTTADIDNALSVSHGTGSWTSSVIGTVDANIVSSNNIDFTALQKTSLNAATPASVGTVTGNVAGSVNSVTNPVTVTGYVQVTGTVDANVEKWNTIDVVSNAVPAFAAGAVGGLPTVDANNYVAGIQGTKNQLDDLNDIAAGTQMDLVNAPNATALNAIADAQLIRDWTAITGVVPSRSELNALRFLRNKWSVAAGILTVTEEDDAVTAWTSVISADATASPIIGSDPA